MERRERIAEVASRTLSRLWVVAIGLGAAAAVSQLSEVRRKTLLVLLAGLAVPWIAVLSQQPAVVLWFTWVLALSYNRNYFSFDRFLGDHGSQGFYWLPSDPVLLLVAGLWIHQRVILHRAQPPRGGAAWPVLLPFFAACGLSAVLATRTTWALFELIRILKFCLVIWFVRRGVGSREWWGCLAAFGAAVAAQSAYGLLQVATKGRFTIGKLFRAGGELDATLQSLQTDLVQEWHRATGTLGHPNILAPFLLLTVPALVAVGFAADRPRVRWLSLAAGVIGLLGIVATLSRMAWALCLLSMGALAIGLAVIRVVSVIRLVGMIAVLGFVGAIGLLPFAEKIEDRLTRDLKASIAFRSEYDRIAIDIFDESPIVGVGLNNFSEHLRKYDPSIEEFLNGAELVRKGIGIRVTAAVHNLYLLLLAETGLLGLATFGVFLFGVMTWGCRAVVRTDGVRRAAVLGLTIGVLAVLGQQFTEFSLWADPVLFAFALVAGMLNVAPALAAEERRADAAATRTSEAGSRLSCLRPAPRGLAAPRGV